ncbi:carbohydrate sulfotransferase 15-like [Ruditapes philippinarum]|uniref:carbohydrate sulfotransferase 15-like n=1 Tax=Ruditapes philippinarum TaxID=129788 RepID=UPI00295BB12B|nr:carbohydrate sulfotransferase 15-like [Ruditapes philippinarum]
MKFPPFTNADVIRRLNPDAKIIIMLRNPVSRLYSEYLYFREDGQSVEEFHNRVVSALYNMNDCFRKYSVRYCIYFMGTGPRLQIGFYHIYIEDFFRAFPREQVKILKLENYSQQINDTMIDVYRFLGLDKPPDEAMTRIENKRQANERDTEDKQTGDMLPKTRHMLAEFYKPWNEKLVQLIGEEFRY